MTKSKGVIVSPVAVPPPTTIPSLPTVPSVPEVTVPTVPPPPPIPSVLPPAPLAPGTGVKATVRVWHSSQIGARQRLHASCPVEVLAGSDTAALLDAAQATGCIRSWMPNPWSGDPNDVFCIDGVCAAVADEFRPFAYDHWEVSGGETIDFTYWLRSVNGCNLWYGYCW